MTNTHVAVGIVAVALLGTIAATSDHEHEHEHERCEHRSRHDRRSSAAAPSELAAHAVYVQECGACHLPFPPGLLPTDSHRRIMAALDRHFGQNAELDRPVRDGIERYLVDHAAETGSFGKSRKVMASLDGTVPARITDVPWFQRRHRSGVCHLASVDPSADAVAALRSRTARFRARRSGSRRRPSRRSPSTTLRSTSSRRRTRCTSGRTSASRFANCITSSFAEKG